VHLIYHLNQIDLLNVMNVQKNKRVEKNFFLPNLPNHSRAAAIWCCLMKKKRKKRDEYKKNVSLLKFAISKPSINERIYHLYTFQNRVESFWQCWFYWNDWWGCYWNQWDSQSMRLYGENLLIQINVEIFFTTYIPFQSELSYTI